MDELISSALPVDLWSVSPESCRSGESMGPELRTLSLRWKRGA